MTSRHPWGCHGDGQFGNLTSRLAQLSAHTVLHSATVRTLLHTFLFISELQVHRVILTISKQERQILCQWDARTKGEKTMMTHAKWSQAWVTTG